MTLEVKDKVYENAGNHNVIDFISIEKSLILDIGCGAGDNAKILKGKGHQIDGITLSEEEKTIASQYFNEIFVHNLELGLPLGIKNKKYDYIICSHVLEHIAFPTKLLNDLYKLSKDSNTQIIVLLPNIMYYKTRLKLIGGKFDYTKDGIMDYTHLRWYTLNSAKLLFKAHNFKVEIAKVDGFLPFHSVTKKLGDPIYKLIKNILYKLAPTFWGSELIFLLKNK